MARDQWTDERLDELNQRVDAGFAETRAEIRALREKTKTEIRAQREETRTEIRELREDMRETRVEIGALTRAMHQLAFGKISALIVGFFGTIAALITLV